MDREPDPPPGPPAEPDLDLVERELADVEVAMDRLEDGTYWTDERTGEPLPDALLDEHPAARRNDP
jgi:RNA polymerase-binding transcription factor DksA